MKYKRQKTKVSEYISHADNMKKFSKKSGFKRRAGASFILVLVMFLLSGTGIVKRPVVKSIFGHTSGVGEIFSVKVLEKSKLLKTAGESVFDFCFGYLRKNDSSESNAYAISDEKVPVAVSSGETAADTGLASDGLTEPPVQAVIQKTFEPVWPCRGEISSEFGARVHPVSGENKFHGGIDIAVSEGTKIFACEDGTVTTASFNEYSGNHVILTHENGYTSSYSHMSALAVAEGAIISQGDILGYAGSTGIATGPHLHFEIKHNGVLMDPAAFLCDDIG